MKDESDKGDTAVSDFPGPEAVPSNPYAAPSAPTLPAGIELVGDFVDAERVRRDHFNFEMNIKSLGSLYILGGIVGGLGTLALFVAAFNTARRPMVGGDGGPPPAVLGGVLFGVAGFYLLATALNLAVGIGLRGLQPWARWTAVVLTSLGLLYVLGLSAFQLLVHPVVGLIVLLVGGLIPALILYLLLAPKATVVFSPDYKQVIAATPHVRYKTSLVVKLLLVVLLAVIAVAVLAALGSRG